jgi:hypothetical protein
MSLRAKIWILGLLACAASAVWAQDSSTPPQSDSTTQSGTASTSNQSQEPVPAYGQQNAPPPVSENPPISGLDLPSLEPHAAPLSFLQWGATGSESADSNAGQELGAQEFRSVSRALGSLTLHRLWSHYDLGVDYIGGVGYYDVPSGGFRNLQQMDFVQRITWKRGALSVRDSFSYLPDGNFGGAYGSLGSEGIQSLGGTSFSSFWGGTALGTLGNNPRILNLALVEADEMLSPKSAITATGGYALLHFFGTNDVTNAPFVGSWQTSAQVAYDRVLTPKTQIAAAFAYQNFNFTVEGSDFHADVIQFMYGHQITGRMDFMIAAGPQFTFITLPCNNFLELLTEPAYCYVTSSGGIGGLIPDTRIGAAGRMRLRYRLGRTTLNLSAERFETAGSGLFAGAETTMVHLTADRQLSRVWGLTTDIGYSHNVRIQPGGSVPGTDYNYEFAGLAFHRAFSRALHGFLSYQYNEVEFDKSFCSPAAECNRISGRQVITVGLDWTPPPRRID